MSHPSPEVRALVREECASMNAEMKLVDHATLEADGVRVAVALVEHRQGPEPSLANRTLVSTRCLVEGSQSRGKSSTIVASRWEDS